MQPLWACPQPGPSLALVHRSSRQDTVAQAFGDPEPVGSNRDHTASTRSSRYSDLEHIARDQAGVVSRAQALQLGVTDMAIACSLAARRWQQVHRGVYALFTGSLPESSRFWAAVLYAGHGAVLDKASALRAFGLTQFRDEGVVHVLIDHASQTIDAEGIAVTRRRNLQRFVHPAKRPPSVRLEDAALHLAAGQARLGEGLGVLADCCQARATTPDRLRVALNDLPRLRHRRHLLAVLDDVATGAHTFLEVSYLRKVERAHGLPTPERQRMALQAGQRIWRDGDYPAWGVALELDGRLGHEWTRDRRRDRRRDIIQAGEGGVTLRHGYEEVLDEACESAALVARVLKSRGWLGSPHDCVASCRMSATLRLLAA